MDRAYFRDYFDGVEKVDITDKKQIRVLNGYLTSFISEVDDNYGSFDGIDETEFLDLLYLINGILSELTGG